MKLPLLFLALSLLLFSCKPKDSVVQANIIENFSGNSRLLGVTATVENGVATLTGDCKDQAAKDLATSVAKNVKGVDSVVNNCVVIPSLITAPK